MNTIIAKGYVNVRTEKNAGATITPGMLVEIAADGDFEPHSVSGGPGAKIFALEDAYQGNTITDDYSAGDRVIAQHFTPGEEVNAIASGDSTNAIAVGDLLISNGDGTLSALSHASADSIGEAVAWIGVALEAAEGGEHFRVLII